ncbi:MAG: hypothetical protein ACKOXO_03410 [Cyanobium sp.]
MALPSPQCSSRRASIAFSHQLRRSALLIAGSLLLAITPLQAQQAETPYDRVRALNLARNTATRLNGGLSLYHPAACMFATSEVNNPCLLRRDPQGFLFRFLGGPPGWQVQNSAPTSETEILVSPDGRSVLQVLYNGNPR